MTVMTMRQKELTEAAVGQQSDTNPVRVGWYHGYSEPHHVPGCRNYGRAKHSFGGCGFPTRLAAIEAGHPPAKCCMALPPVVPSGFEPRAHKKGGMVEALREVNAAFHYGPGRDDNVEFWLRMAEAQVKEAREHLAKGEVEKALGEIADLIPVAFDALEKLGKDPEAFVETRARTRILPRIPEITAMYVAGDGHKGQVTA